ncbi:hypothetical protein PM082_022161 [Marasmius tenuissimus]|nr:hypothetical protein PM082_022161 [Marasmius tenuissimus]
MDWSIEGFGFRESSELSAQNFPFVAGPIPETPFAGDVTILVVLRLVFGEPY